MMMSAASARAAPVTMFLTNSLWPGASMMTYSRFWVRNQIWLVSMVMFWSRSACRRVHEVGELERHAAALRDRDELLVLALGQRAGVVEQPADER